MPAILPNSSGDLRRSRLADELRKAAKRHQMRLRDLIDTQIEATIAELRKITPKDTGAGAGMPTGHLVYKTHPGYGMNIGNERGDTGWQPYSNHPDHWAIINPMWEPYLKIVNYTHYKDSHFLETAVQHMRERIKYLSRV